MGKAAPRPWGGGRLRYAPSGHPPRRASTGRSPPGRRAGVSGNPKSARAIVRAEPTRRGCIVGRSGGGLVCSFEGRHGGARHSAPKTCRKRGPAQHIHMTTEGATLVEIKANQFSALPLVGSHVAPVVRTKEGEREAVRKSKTRTILVSECEKRRSFFTNSQCIGQLIRAVPIFSLGNRVEGSFTGLCMK